MMVQMHMQGGDDDVMLVVLHLGQAAGQVVLVMVIDQGQRACALAVGLLPLLGHKGLADEVTDGFGAVAVALDGAQGVERFQQLFIQRNTKTCQFSHCSPHAAGTPSGGARW